jgi:hypothetical protein
VPVVVPGAGGRRSLRYRDREDSCVGAAKSLGAGLTITETVLVFVCIPLAVTAVVYALVYGSSAARSKRYRPGRPFATAPVWFLAENDPTAPHAPLAHAPHAALVGATEAAAEDATETVRGEVGGASDSW